MQVFHFSNRKGALCSALKASHAAVCQQLLTFQIKAKAGLKHIFIYVGQQKTIFVSLSNYNDQPTPPCILMRTHQDSGLKEPTGRCQSYLFCVDAFGHGPGGDNVVHDSLAQSLGNLVQLQKVPDIVEHLVVAVGVGIHLLEDGCDVSKDGGIKKSCKETQIKKVL